MLADKLVNNLAYDTDREVQNLELLKLRFGESSMHHCEIMVRLFGSFCLFVSPLAPTRVLAEGLLANQYSPRTDAASFSLYLPSIRGFYTDNKLFSCNAKPRAPGPVLFFII